MPSINLRLTKEQHEALETWAHDGHRSLQKEIIFRLFTNASATDSFRHPAYVDDYRSRTDHYPHFKPDFK